MTLSSERLRLRLEPICCGASPFGSPGKRMPWLMARHADIWNRDFDAVNPGLTRYSPTDLMKSSTRVDAACAVIGRDPATLEGTAGVWVDLPTAPRRDGWDSLTGTPDEFAAGLRFYADSGYSQVEV